MRRTLQEVLKKPAYLAVAVVFGFLIFALAVWLRNLPFLGTLIVSSAFSIPDKFSLFAAFLGGIATNMTPFSAFLIIGMSMLFGVNTTLFAYYLVQKRNIPKREGAGAVSALVSGILGVGCASCGSFLLGALLASFGAAGAITLLPLRGEEFTILAVVLLSLSIYWMAKSIQSGNLCAIK